MAPLFGIFLLALYFILSGNTRAAWISVLAALAIIAGVLAYDSTGPLNLVF